MQWAYPERWILVLVVPALTGFWIWASTARREALGRLAQATLWPQLSDMVHWSRRRARAVVLTLAVFWLITALAGPQWGFHWEEVKRRGIDIVMALDVSRSMLVEDVKPNRLERAKLAIKDLIPLLRGDRVGLVAFAGTSFLQCPLTVDYDAFTLTLDEMTTETIPRGGTAIAQAIRTSIKAFEHSAEGARALVLITDGEDQEDDPLAAAQEAAKAGVKIFCVGIGTTEGELIPMTDEQGHQTFIKDRQGRTVKSRLEEKPLQRIALETGGSYVRATATSLGLDLLYRDQMARLDQHETKSLLQKQYEHRFQWPLAVALALLAIEMLIGDRRRSTSAKVQHGAKTRPADHQTRTGVKTAGIIAALLISVISCLSLTPALAAAGNGSQAVPSSESTDHHGATQTTSEHEQRADDPIAQYNAGTTLYGKEQYRASEEAFNHALSSADSRFQARISYNLGNARYRQAHARESTAPGEAIDLYRKALDDYRLALERDPQDRDAAFNYELTERRMKRLAEQQSQSRQGKTDKQQSSQKQSTASQQQAGASGSDEQRQQDGATQNARQGQEQQAAQAQQGRQQQPQEQPQQAAGTDQEQQQAQNAAAEQTAAGQDASEHREQATPAGTSQNASKDGELSEQQALWILDTVKREEQQAPTVPPSKTASDRPVERDW